MTNSDFQRRCTELEAQYEGKDWTYWSPKQSSCKRKDQSTKAQLTDLPKQPAEAQYNVSMGEEKINAILKRHRINTLKQVSNSLDKGWKTWSAHAAELQLLSADRDNRFKPNQNDLTLFKPNQIVYLYLNE